jgi:hypothetical protein
MFYQTVKEKSLQKKNLENELQQNIILFQSLEKQISQINDENILLQRQQNNEYIEKNSLELQQFLSQKSNLETQLEQIHILANELKLEMEKIKKL